jgi:predicted esterase
MKEAALGFHHRFLPGTEGGAEPVLILLHGTGGNENDLLELGGSLFPGAARLSPRGKILENGVTPRFFRRLAEGVFDEEDLIFRTHELADFILAARAAYGLGTRPAVAIGYSNGANIAASLLLLRPGILQGAVLLRAMTPLEPPKAPDLAETPVLLLSGRQDPIVPRENVEHLVTLLREAGADITIRWSDGGHQLEAAEIQAARDWLSSQTWPEFRQN